VEQIDRVIMNLEDPLVIEKIRKEVNEMMADYPMFA
jgi:glycine/serine hydroxymethyltransferase